MATPKSSPMFAICVNTNDPNLLTPRMVYEVLPDEAAAKSNFIRVIDNEGEDYCYPADFFVLVKFPTAVNNTLKQLTPLGARSETKYKTRSSAHSISEK